MKLKDSAAAKIGASIAVATGLYGVSFGALSVASGLTFWQTMVLSLLLFSGGSQFAFIGVVANLIRASSSADSGWLGWALLSCGAS